MFEEEIKSVINFLLSESFPPIILLLFTFFIAFLENVFPPSPSDVILIFLGTLVGIQKIDFVSTLLFATAGSAFGFSLMFWIGRHFGVKIIETNKLKFIKLESIEKSRRWFNKWGYFIIIINRFLSGTRAVISFFAGMSHLKFFLTILFAFLGSLIWNSILILLGKFLGETIAVNYMNWFALGTIILVILITLFFIIKYLVKKNKAKKQIQ